MDRDLFFSFFFTFFVTETRSFSQNGPLKFFTITTVLIDNISYSNTFVSCRLHPLSVIKILKVFGNLLIVYSNLFCLNTHTTTTTSVHVLITEPKISSNVNYQINFKGFFFSLNFFSCRQGDSWLGLRDPGHVVYVWTSGQRKRGLYWNQHIFVRVQEGIKSNLQSVLHALTVVSGNVVLSSLISSCVHVVLLV